MRVLVCGGRDYRNGDRVDEVLTGLKSSGLSMIIEGGAGGADRLARQWAVANSVSRQMFPARWNAYGNAAGPIRNQQMIDEGRPDLVVAFPGGRGTADMVSRAEAAGISVVRA